MEPSPRQSFEPAGAGALLLATGGATTGAGAFIGWIFGNATLGAIAGLCVGIPAGVFAVYRRYRGYFR
jgi:hypothetical protein